ncbi:ROK family transcriptional regulator [Aquipuribacter sp. SD81]|uniref:ROK family transcriptional regulator n=1 Tax=Aquipuribacter sp. SD81 TaxID=3127703 RepID=UPI00301AF426
MSTRAPGPGSLAGLRRANRDRVLGALADHGEVNQATLARETGLSSASVSGLVRTLVGEGAVVVRDGTANGRRGRLVSLRRTASAGVGIDLGRRHCRVVVGGADGDVLAEAVAELEDDHLPDDTLPVVDDLVRRCSEAAGVAPAELAVAGLGVPGPVEPSGERITGGTILRGWTDLPVRETLGAALGVPVFVDNDANMGVVGVDSVLGSDSGLVFVKVGSGIGAGVAVGGRVVRGVTSMAGEIGHLPVDTRLPTMCRCGRRGCLETAGSSGAVLASLGAALGRRVTMPEALELVADRDPVALAVLEDAGNVLGRALAGLGMALNPGVVALAGALPELGEPYLEPVRTGFRQAVLPAINDATAVVVSPLGARTVAVGALVAALRATAAAA